MKKLLCLTFTSALLLPLAASHSAPAAEAPVSASPSEASEEGAYAAGTRALNEQRWPDAIRAFDRVIAVKGGKRVDAALYWKAYTLVKISHPADAAASCQALRDRFPVSTWNADCGALSIDSDGGAGGSASSGVSKSAAGPASDDDLKMLALNSLAHQDPARAMPILREMLSGNQPADVKKHALFALTLSGAPEAASILRDAVNGKMGPVIQIDAIQASGVFEGRRANDTLAELYRTTQDMHVKHAVISAFFVSNDAPRMVKLARSENNLELKRSIVSQLALMDDKAATEYMLELLK